MLDPIKSFIKKIPLFFYRSLNAHIEDGYSPRKVIVITAHPDDPEYFFGGTVAKWAQTGSIVKYVICTSGEIGTKNRTLTKNEVADVREREQIAAAELIGVKEVVFLHYKDGLLENSFDLRCSLVREIRSFQPEVVIINDPNISYGDNFINHPDHRAAATAGMDAVFPLAGLPLAFCELEQEGIQAHEVKKLYIQTWQRPNTWIDITETIDLKIAAIRKHTSQIGSNDPSEEVRTSAARAAQFTRISYSETFRVIELATEN